MARNNKNTYTFKSNNDVIRRAREINKSIDIYSEDRFKSTKEDIDNIVTELIKGRNVIVNSNVGTINTKKNNFKNKVANKNYEYSSVTKAIENLYSNNFYSVISGKVSTGEDLIVKAIENNKKVSINNQKGKSNESLKAVMDKYDLMKQVKENNGSYFVYDLETLGGKDAHGIWRPTHITEFSMHEYSADGSKSNKVDIVLGWKDNKETENLLNRIETAVKDGSIEYDEELRVTAHRLSLYGDKRTRAVKDEKLGYFKMENFIDSDEGDYRDLKRIREGVEFFKRIGKETTVDEYGISADVRAMMSSLSNVQRNLKPGHNMLVDYNGSLHDLPIMNYVGNQVLDQNPLLREQYFTKHGINFSFNPESDTHFDFFGMMQHFRSNFSTKDILGDSITDITENRLNRQEHYVKALYEDLFNSMNLRPHEASSDVTALSFFFTKGSDKLGGKTLMDFMGEKLKTVTDTKESYVLNPMEHIFKAKAFNNGTYGGKNMLNFAISQDGQKIFTADNHMIRNGVVQKKDFNVGVGINQGAYYKLRGMGEFEATQEYIDIVKESFPQYTSGKLYSVTLDMMTTDEYKGTRLEDLSQVFIFNSETERDAFLGNTLDVVAKKGKDGQYKIIDRDAFDIREYDMIKGKPVYKDVHDNWAKSDKELIEKAVSHENKKLVTSRAERAINGDNAYKKIGQALEIQQMAQKTINRNITNRELNMIMAEKVSKGQMPIDITEPVRLAMQRSAREILEWKGELYDSTIDNMSTYMDNIADNKAYYEELFRIVKKHDKFKDEMPSAVKKELFKRADRHARETLASGIYNNEIRIKKSVQGDEALQTSLSKFKNMYELDLSKIPGARRVFNYDITQANPTHLLRLDLGKTANLDYDLIGGVMKALHGDKKFASDKERTAVEKRDFRKFIGMMLEDEDFNNSLSKDFRKELKSIVNDNADYHHVDVSDRIIKQISSIKQANPLSGIISKELYMKELSSSSGFTKALNGEKFLSTLESEINNLLDNTNLVVINGNRGNAESFVKNNLLKHYVPLGQEDGFIHRKVTQEMTDYLTELVYSIDKIGASISINDVGDITMHDAGKVTTLSLPKIKKDMDSGTWYINTGNMNNKLSLALKTKSISGGYGIDLDIQTTFAESIGTYPMSKSVDNFYKTKGASATKEAMDYIETLTNTGKKKLIKNPTINSFNGNDANSNRLINISSIKEVLPELFGENGKLNYLVKNKKFLDTNLQEVLGKDIAKHLQRGASIEELDAYMINTLSKNAEHILGIIAEKAGVNGTEIGEILKQVSFTTNDKQMSSLTGIVGDMPLFSPQTALDNVQRPPVLAAGNAIPIRMNNVKRLEAEGSGVLAGNLISSASIDKATLRHVAGVGETTTDVMMDIAYVDTSALEVMKNNRMDKVLNNSKVEDNYKQRMMSMFSKMNTYEQERHLDGRIAERLYGLMPSKVQNISASKDIVSAINLMDLDSARNQLDDIINVRGNITIDKSGVLSYKSATGKFVKRGESVINILGYGDKLESVSPGVRNGVFLHKYIKTNGMVLNDSEITEIINQHKDLFMTNGKLNNKIKATATLEQLLQEKYSANSSYRIQDVSAAGFIKPTTSSVEKGMTNLNYLKTGSLDKNVDKFFKSIGMEDVSRQSVLTEEGIDAMLAYAGKNKVKKALKEHFGSVSNLKAAINKERNAFNAFLIDDMLEGKAHMLVNDGVFKHGGAGQVQFGMLNKAIDNLIKHNNNDIEGTLKQVTGIINSSKEYQFLETRNLNTSKSEYTKFRIKDGRIHMDDMGTNIENLSISNIKKLENLIERLDSEAGGGLVHTEGYVRKWIKNETTGEKELKLVSLKESGEKLFGDWTTEEIDGKKVFISPITKESVKLLPDVETQTGTESKYFEIQEHLKVLRSRKNSSNDPTERTRLMEQISVLEQELKNYESVSKRMSIGSTEFQLLERIRVTDQHAQQMQELIAKGELTDEIIASEALKGRVRMVDGKIEVDDKLKAPVLDHWLKRFKGQLSYNPLQEEKLTKEMVDGEFKHLKTIFDNANKYGYDLGVESAEKIHQLEMADIAVKYNAKGDMTTEGLVNLGFEKRAIDEILFETDEIAKKNLLIDLGPEFQGKNRYIAVAGTGHKLGEDDEILTNGQKELRKLAHRYDQWKSSRHDDELEAQARKAVEEQTEEAISAIKKSIYGKNAYADQLNKVQVDDVNYRYKASGAVTSELVPGLNMSVKRAGSSLEINDDLLKTRQINGKSLLDWHKEGVHYDYKFVSLEAMENMGMFNQSTMEAYGAKSREDMIAKLKKHGTMDITDRYPNNKNDSMLLTHVFLDEELVGNQTKVSGVSGLKMLLDHDGDSVSSFALRYKNADGSFVDFGMFANNPEYVKKTNAEAYEAFSNMLGTTTMRAATENKKWLDDVNDILVKDAIKNSELGDLSKTALVPGGKSVLGKVAPAAISHMGGLEDTNKNFEAVDDMIKQVSKYIEDGSINTKVDIKGKEELLSAKHLDLEKNKSEIVLDRALTALQDAHANNLITKDELRDFESTALKRVAIDKASIAAHAKTGVATTGAINVATNSIKRAVHDTLKDENMTTVDLFRSLLDIPEQEAISSKKIVSAYDDKRARDMTEILGNMFGSNQSQNLQLNRNDMKDLRNWFETHAKEKVEDIYDEFKGRLNPNVVAEANKTGNKFGAIMNLFEEELEGLSNNEFFQGRRLHYKTRGEVSTGASNAVDDYAAVLSRLRGKADDGFVDRATEMASIKRQVAESREYANEFHVNSGMVKKTAQVSMDISNALTSGVKVGSSLGMAALGLAGGLMAAGYASGNPLNDKQASQVVQEEQQPVQTMSIPDFMDKQGGYVTGNTQQGYIINIKADTKKGRKHMQRIMKQAAEASVGGAVSVNMNIKNLQDRGITDSDIENFLNRHL